MAENRTERRARAVAVIERLGSAWPQARIALRYSNPFELMVAVLLSAQTTDLRVNQVTGPLFARCPGPRELAAADGDWLEAQLRPLGLFRSKARALRAASAALVETHGGEVPLSREALARLPGIGNKSAGVIAMHLGGEPSLPVDTHVRRLAWRLGFTRERDPDRVERDLRELLPPELWAAAHHRLIWHGRGICLARAPRCPECPVAPLCPKRGVARAGAAAPRARR